MVVAGVHSLGCVVVVVVWACCHGFLDELSFF